MANGLEHKDLIKSLKEGFALYFNERLGRGMSVKVAWEFPEKDLEHTSVSGHGSEKLKVIKTMFKVKDKGGFIKKEISVDLIEDDRGTLTVMVNGNTACSTGPMKGISSEFLKSFANSLKGAI